MFKIYDGRSEFYQWDSDRKIIVSDPTIDEVHFCNKTDDCSLVVEVYEEDGLKLANVPNILLQTDWPIRAYGYCGGCYTKISATFKVIARTRPSDYVYTETEIKRWEDYVAEVADLTEQAEKAVEEAEAEAIKASNFVKEAEAAANRAAEEASEAAAASAAEKAEQFISELGIVQETGESESAVMSQKATTDALRDLYDAEIPVGEIVNGQMITAKGMVSTDAASCTTDFIPVMCGYTLHIEGCYVRYSRSICAYDEKKTFVECVATESKDTEVAYTVPSGVGYIRITGAAGIAPKITKTSHPISRDIENLEALAKGNKTTLEAVAEESKAALDAVNKLGVTSLDVGELTNGCFDPNLGTVIDTSSSMVTDFIAVLPRSRVEIKGAYLSTNTRNIIGYDEYKAYVTCFVKNTNDTEYVIESVPPTVKYIRICCRLDTPPAVLQINAPTKADIYVDDITYDINEFEDGYIADKSNGETVTASTKWCRSPFIAVHPHQEIELTYYAPLAGVAFYCYDENKKFVSYVSPLGADGSLVSTRDRFVLPYDAHFIRVHASRVSIAKFKLYYTEQIARDKYALDYVKEFFEGTHKRAKSVFQTAKKKPILTIIDDDTCDLVQVSRFHDFCMALGIRGTFACLTKFLEDDTTGVLKDTLLEYEREGFHITLHSHTQNKLYETIAEKSWAGESWSEEDWITVEKDFVTGAQKLKEYGFVDYKFWVTPYGVRGGVFDDLARKWGMHCSVGCGGSEYESDKAERGRYGLNRPSIGGTDESSSQTLAGMKALIDDAVQNNGWLLVCTHMWEEGWVDNLDRFRELVEYAKAAGMEVKTLNEAWRIREPIYRLYETF